MRKIREVLRLRYECDCSHRQIAASCRLSPSSVSLRVAEKHGGERMDAACARALSGAGSSAPHRKYIEAILKRGLEHVPSAPSPIKPRTTTTHENVRGGDYYDKEERS